MSVLVRAMGASSAVALMEGALAGGAGGGPLGGAAAAHAEQQCVCVGDTIDTDEQEGYLRGHGTHLVDGRLVASLCGVVERVNRLVYVRPLRARYDAAQGDVVVGRVVEVGGKRWRVELGGAVGAGLALSAVALPAGAQQRRRNAEDELSMREVLREGDLLSAEVQSVSVDGGVALHTRSAKYGKLEGGQLVTVPPPLVKRQKQHFHTLEALGVDLILGCNGCLWVAPARPAAAADTSNSQRPGAPLPAAAPAAPFTPSRAQMEAVVRVGGAIRALAACYLPIFPASIMEAVELALDAGVPPSDMAGPDMLAALVAREVARRAAAAGAQ